MRFDIELIYAYIKNFFKKWYVWLSIIFGVIGSIGLFYLPSLLILIVIVLALSFLGIIFSGYLVYQELFDIIPADYRLAYLPPKRGLPQVKISQIGGNEYRFGYRVFRDFQLHQSPSNGDVFPDLAGHFNLKVKNIGYIPIDILSIDGRINDPVDNLRHSFSMSVDSALSTNLIFLSYPFTLEHKDEIELTLFVTVTPRYNNSDAQLAISLREWHESEKKDFILVNVNFVDISGKSHWASEKFYFSSESILDLYFRNIRSLDNNELLRLAGVE